MSRLVSSLFAAFLALGWHASADEIPVAPIRIVIIGDSTVCEYPPESPSRGWGHYLQGYFKSRQLPDAEPELKPLLR